MSMTTSQLPGGRRDTDQSTTMSTPLTWRVFLSEPRPVVTTDLPPNLTQQMFPPISATLIVGSEDAVLVDPLLTIEDARALGAWVAATGKNLTTIYATHGHGDHFFGAGIIRDRFPHARFVATPPVIKRMQQDIAPNVIASLWNAWFPGGQIPDRPIVAEPLERGVVDLEGHDLVAVPLGQTDTLDTTCPACSLDRSGRCRRRRLQRRSPPPRGVEPSI